jgi:hypothetical protein
MISPKSKIKMIVFNVKGEKLKNFLYSCDMQKIKIICKNLKIIVEKNLRNKRKTRNNTRNFKFKKKKKNYF